jgi:hypothetical protein
VKQTLGDRHYLKHCQQNGIERVGVKGGSERLAAAIAQQLNKGLKPLVYTRIISD